MNTFAMKTTAFGTIALAIAGTSLLVAPAASATQTSSSCIGTLVQDTPLNGQYSGKTYGYFELYWDASTGQNCAMVVSSSSTWGESKYMSVSIGESTSDSPTTSFSSDITDAQQSDWFKYYAGPVSVPGAGHCISIFAEIGGIPDGAYTDSVTYAPSMSSHC